MTDTRTSREKPRCKCGRNEQGQLPHVFDAHDYASGFTWTMALTMTMLTVTTSIVAGVTGNEHYAVTNAHLCGMFATSALLSFAIRIEHKRKHVLESWEEAKRKAAEEQPNE